MSLEEREQHTIRGTKYITDFAGYAIYWQAATDAFMINSA